MKCQECLSLISNLAVCHCIIFKVKNLKKESKDKRKLVCDKSVLG